MRTGDVIWEKDALRLVEFHGPDARPLLKDMARLRIETFCEFPYLYKGSLEYETEYLSAYFNCDAARVDMLYDGGRIGGMAAHIPLGDAWPDVRKGFADCGLDPSVCYYYGEMILEPAYRLKKISNITQRRVEERARSLGLQWVTAITVRRAPEYPDRPEGYVSFDHAMRRWGYEHIPNARITISWPTMPHGDEEAHPILFWRKSASPQAG